MPPSEPTSAATVSPFDGSCDHRDIRTFYSSELGYLKAMRKRYACANCATSTGECSSCRRTRERIEELEESTSDLVDRVLHHIDCLHVYEDENAADYFRVERAKELLGRIKERV